MKVRPEQEPSPSPAGAAQATSALGDWYANLVFLDRRQLVLCCSERTFLPVVLPARDIGSLLPRLRVGLVEILTVIGVPSLSINDALAAMEDFTVRRTASKVVLGVMNDFAWQLECMPAGPADAGSMLELSLALAEAPLGPLRMENAMAATRDVFSKGLVIH